MSIYLMILIISLAGSQFLSFDKNSRLAKRGKYLLFNTIPCTYRFSFYAIQFHFPKFNIYTHNRSERWLFFVEFVFFKNLVNHHIYIQK